MSSSNSHTQHKTPVLQVANTKKETVFKWLKDDVLYETEKMPDLEKGVCELLIPKVCVCVCVYMCGCSVISIMCDSLRPSDSSVHGILQADTGVG